VAQHAGPKLIGYASTATSVTVIQKATDVCLQ
jgi:hypothetical protein